MSKQIEVVSFGQSLSVAGMTFGTSVTNGKITSWRVDNEDVSEDEFNRLLKSIHKDGDLATC